jgi:hypothetical protein
MINMHVCFYRPGGCPEAFYAIGWQSTAEAAIVASPRHHEEELSP